MDPRLTRDVHRMSTEDLVICWAFIRKLAADAAARGDEHMRAEFSARLRAIDSELGDRQGRLDDELQKLRRLNESAS